MSTSYEEDCDYLFKAVMVGDSAVGKSNLLSRFSKDEFCLESKPTLGVEFANRTIQLGDKVIKTQIWDTAGQERFRAITTTYYRGSHGALLVYDITRRATFESVAKWLRELRHYGNPDMVVVLVGNKSDLTNLREVRLEEGKELAEVEDLYFMETSALENLNVEEAFVQMIKRIHQITRKKILERKNTGTASSGTGIQPGRRIVQLEEVTPVKKKIKCCDV